jgi:hypothetical protein
MSVDGLCALALLLCRYRLRRRRDELGYNGEALDVHARANLVDDVPAVQDCHREGVLAKDIFLHANKRTKAGKIVAHKEIEREGARDDATEPVVEIKSNG